MKYVQIIAACDMTKAGTGEIVQAAETVYIAFGTDPKKLDVRELDLDADWAKGLREFLAPYLAASHEPGELITPAENSHPDEGEVDKRQYKRNCVAWAQEQGYKVTRLVRGGWYVPVRTRKAYTHHLAGRDDLLTGANGLQPDYDPATGNLV